MAANGQLLRDSLGRVVNYTPANPGALRFLKPATPPSQPRTTVNTSGAVAKVQHPNLARVATLNAANVEANAAAVRAARNTTGQ
jgi:hypothetical protein